MTRDDIAAVGESIARSGMRNQLRAVRAFMALAESVEYGDAARRKEIAAALRDVAGSIISQGADNDAARIAKREAAAAQGALPLAAGKRKGRATGPIDENE